MKKLQLPDLGPVWRLLLYLATAVFAVLSIVCAAFEGMFPEEPPLLLGQGPVFWPGVFRVPKNGGLENQKTTCYASG